MWKVRGSVTKRKYSKAYKLQIIEMRKQGMTRKAISVLFGMQISSIWNWELDILGRNLPVDPKGLAGAPPEIRRETSRAGGLAVSRDRRHMSELGKKGGAKVSQDRAHMARIGAIGGSKGRGLAKRRILEGEKKS